MDPRVDCAWGCACLSRIRHARLRPRKQRSEARISVGCRAHGQGQARPGMSQTVRWPAHSSGQALPGWRRAPPAGPTLTSRFVAAAGATGGLGLLLRLRLRVVTLLVIV